MKFENKPWYSDYIRTKETKDFSLLTFIKDFIFYHRVRYMVYFRIAQKTKSKLIKLNCEQKLYRF